MFDNGTFNDHKVVNSLLSLVFVLVPYEPRQGFKTKRVVVTQDISFF